MHQSAVQYYCTKFGTTMAYKAFRTKLKLNNEQKTVIAQHAGYARWVYNWALALWIEADRSGLKPNANKLKKLFTNHVKPQYEWMGKLSSRVYQYVFINLGEAFSRFFKKLGSYPRFKKKGRHDSFTLDNCGRAIKIGGTRHKLPFIGWISTYEGMPECTTKRVTISREAGEWFISYFIEHEPQATLKLVDIVGIDLGINVLATLSTGEVFPNLKPYRIAKKQLARLQRQLSRKQIGSKNREKARLGIAKLHQRIANIRRDSLHKLTTYLAKNHGVVVIEDLNVSGMMANHKLAGAVAEMGFYEFRRQLQYKCECYSSKLVVVYRFYPSSQLCSCCGNQQKMPLSQRVYDCLQCGVSLARDLNAAKNLAKAAG